MEELYVVIANAGHGQQSLWPRTRYGRGTGGDFIFGDPDGKGGITGLYTKEEAEAIAEEQNKSSRSMGFGGSIYYHAQPLSVAHKHAQGLAGNLIRQVQSKIGVMGESAAIKEAPYGSYGFRQVSYNEGDTIAYRNNAGELVTVVVDYKDDDIKRGEPGFEGTTANGRQVWGYDNQVVRVKRSAPVRETKMVRIKKSALRNMIRERIGSHDGPNPPEAFPIRVGWDGGSFDARNDEELEMITRDLVSKGMAYSVDSVSDLEDEVAVGAGIEQYAESAGKIRIKKSELRKIIREFRGGPGDIVDLDTGEVYAENIFAADFAMWDESNPKFRRASEDEVRALHPNPEDYNRGDFWVRHVDGTSVKHDPAYDVNDNWRMDEAPYRRRRRGGDPGGRGMSTGAAYYAGKSMARDSAKNAREQAQEILADSGHAGKGWSIKAGILTWDGPAASMMTMSAPDLEQLFGLLGSLEVSQANPYGRRGPMSRRKAFGPSSRINFNPVLPGSSEVYKFRYTGGSRGEMIPPDFVGGGSPIVQLQGFDDAIGFLKAAQDKLSTLVEGRTIRIRMSKLNEMISAAMLSETPVDIPSVVTDQVASANQEIQSLLQQIDSEEDPAEIDKINDRIKDLKAAVGELEQTAVEATGDVQVEGVLRAGLLRGIIAEAMSELENLEPVDYPHAYDEDAMTADLEDAGFGQWSRDLARELGYGDPNEMPPDMLSRELGSPYDAFKAGVTAKAYAKTV